VYSVSVSLSVSPSPPWRAGQTVTFIVTATINGNPLANTPVWIFVRFIDDAGYSRMTKIAEGTTDSSGKATITCALPFKVSIGGVEYRLPCRTVNFIANERQYYTWSNYVSGKLAYPTRISISAPTAVRPGEEFTISGKLEYESDAGVWSPLGGKTVTLFYNGNRIADVVTASDGTYSITTSIDKPGTYTLKAVYPGEGLTAGAVALARTVTGFMSPAKSPLPQMIAGGLMLLAGML